VTADLLKRLGMNVDYAAVDWGTVVARRGQKSPPGQGGWQMFHTILAGAECVDPTNKYLRANGDKASFGWPSSPQVETQVEAWFDTKTLEQETAIARALNKAALDQVVSAPIGFFLMHQAWRKNVTGIMKGPLPFFSGVEKST
jgi:peptide/nickel transport system substrate-binding protein